MEQKQETHRQTAGGTQPRRLQMIGRTELTVEGVSDVVRFAEDAVLIDTELGMLEIEGMQLRILRLDPERKELVLAGTVDGLLYVDAAPKKRGILRRKSS